MTLATTTPTPDAVPKALGTGYLDPGWFDSFTPDAVDIVFDPMGTSLAAIDVQAALEELDANMAALSSDAADITFDPMGTSLAATDVQAAIEELDTSIASLSSDAADINFTPAGGIAATDVQAAIQELDTEKLGTAAAAAAYQPLDADLTTWAGLTPSANAQSLVTAADYAAMKVLLALTIGTNVQAYDADLTTWAGKTAPSGDVLGTTDTQSVTNKDITTRSVTLTDATPVTIDLGTTDTGILLTLSQTTAFAKTGSIVQERRYVLRIKSTVARAISFSADFRASAAWALPVTTQGGGITERHIFLGNSTDGKLDYCGMDSWT